MFKNRQGIQLLLYFVGIVLMFIVLFLLSRNLIPFLIGTQNRNIDSELVFQKPEFKIDTNKDYLCLIQTNLGNIIIDLFEKDAPLNVNNFIYLSEKGYYNEVLFHRIIKDVLIQSGDRYTINKNTQMYGFGHPGYFIEDEVNWDTQKLPEEKRNYLLQKGFRNNLKVTTQIPNRYSVLMANGGPNTNGSQFFIITLPFNSPLLYNFIGEFTPIGRVIEGFDTVQKINDINVNNQYVPTTDVKIYKIAILVR
ncbi:MAG: peptidylprolyl isomerase [Candidatus Dojkabacteria bacterium]|nr:peptidylprolyl isomerase [Candidatus Dojkabacteria bacterium]